MNVITRAAALVLMLSATAGSSIAAGDQVQRNPPASQQNPAAEHAPTNRIDKVVPTMTGDAQSQPDADKPSLHPPTNRVGAEVPQMKSDDANQADAARTTGSVTPTEQQK